jgi:hypothetical protein
MATEKELLATQRASKAIEDAEVKPAKLAPATVPIIVDWVDLDTGEPQTVQLVVRVLDFDEENRAELMTAHLGRGQLPNLDPTYVEYLRGLSYCFTMWSDKELPVSLQKRLHADRLLVAQLYGVMEAHRDTRFQGSGAEGQGSTSKVRLASTEGLAR